MRAKQRSSLRYEFKSMFETIFQNFTGHYIAAPWSDPLFLFCLGKKLKRESKCSAEFLFQKLKPDHPRAVCGLNISMDLVIFHLSFS